MWPAKTEIGVLRGFKPKEDRAGRPYAALVIETLQGNVYPNLFDARFLGGVGGNLNAVVDLAAARGQVVRVTLRPSDDRKYVCCEELYPLDYYRAMVGPMSEEEQELAEAMQAEVARMEKLGMDQEILRGLRAAKGRWIRWEDLAWRARRKGQAEHVAEAEFAACVQRLRSAGAGRWEVEYDRPAGVCRLHSVAVAKPERAQMESLFE